MMKYYVCVLVLSLAILTAQGYRRKTPPIYRKRSPEMFRTELLQSYPYAPKRPEIDFVAPKDYDIVIASYPQTDTTLLQSIIAQIISVQDPYPPIDVVARRPYVQRSPAIFKSSANCLQFSFGCRPPRIYSQNYPHNVIPKNNAKFIYIYRHPEDTLLSLYELFSRYQEPSLDFNLLYENCIPSYFDHIQSFLTTERSDNILFVSSDKLLSNGRDGILGIAKFLGNDYYLNLYTDNSLLDAIIDRNYYPSPAFGYPNVNYFKGGYGNEVILTADHSKKIKSLAFQTFPIGAEILKEWYA